MQGDIIKSIFDKLIFKFLKLKWDTESNAETCSSVEGIEKVLQTWIPLLSMPIEDITDVTGCIIPCQYTKYIKSKVRNTSLKLLQMRKKNISSGCRVSWG